MKGPPGPDWTLPPGSVVGGYRIESVAGRGGMGVVYRATQLGLDRPVALKLLAPQFAQDASFRERFQRESRLLAAIDHPNVITVHEAGEHEGRLFIAMRFMTGTDLAAVIRQEGKIDPARAGDLVLQVASALDAAHARGLIHRDVKPANILIEERAGREHAYLSDFGLTKHLEASAAELTATGQWVGTVDFMAPEQALGHHVDARADVYALGCVLYMALIGKAPFQRDSAIATVFAHVNEPPPSPRDEMPELAPELDAVVRRALAKAPDERFQSAGDLGRAAVAAARGEATPEPDHTVARGEAAPAKGAKPTKLAARPTRAAEPAGAEPADGRARPRRARRSVILAIAGAVAVVAVLAVVLLSGGESGDSGEDSALGLGPLKVSRIPVPGGPVGVAVDEGSVVIAGSANETVVALDAESGERSEPVRITSGTDKVAVGADAAFTLAPEGNVVRIGPESPPVTKRVPGIDLSDGGDLAFGEDYLFVTSREDGRVTKVDPTSAAVLTRVFAPEPGLDGPLAVGAGSVWVVTNGEDRAFVARLDAETLELQGRVDVGTGSIEGIAFGEEAVWVADTSRNLVHRIDPASGRVTARIRVSTGISSDDIAAGGGAVWLVSASDEQLVRIDPARNRVIGRPVPVLTSGETELAVGESAAWVTDPDRNAVTRLRF